MKASSYVSNKELLLTEQMAREKKRALALIFCRCQVAKDSQSARANIYISHSR